jgi:hypothetical protein
VEIHALQASGRYVEVQVSIFYDSQTDKHDLTQAREYAKKFIRSAKKKSYSRKYR